jgi:hypothetical protein
MGEIKSKVSIHSSDQIKLDLSLQVEANCKQVVCHSWGKQVESDMHSSDQVRFESKLDELKLFARNHELNSIQI